MDELDIRRRLLADPSDRDGELAQALDNDKLRAFADELQAFDKDLEKAMNDIPVPDDLVDKILFHQTTQVHQSRWQDRAPMALAASIALAVGIFIGKADWSLAPTPPTLADIAIQHVLDESHFVTGIDEQVTLSQVNAKLAPFHQQFTHLDGRITYVNHCGFGDAAALHMVMQTPAGEVTVFVVPTSSTEMETFHDHGHDGVIMPVDDTSLIVVGEGDLMPIADDLRSSIDQVI
uniref:DUF3379 family protein n=1 Tax=Thaumasiovibrio occultus TaxID=1891184 RepID=UPI000B358884|nr:DUF3379 family protein [Thaumasiovibrio occultus]